MFPKFNRVLLIAIAAISLYSMTLFSSCEILKAIASQGGGHNEGGVSGYAGHNVPLTDPNEFEYNNLQSGLYPWGNSLINNSYRSKYIEVSQSIGPMNNDGQPDNQAKILALGIGASNPAILFDGFKEAQRNDAGFGDDFVFINGALNAQDLAKILDPQADYWSNVNRIIGDQGYTNEAVQIIFCMEDNLKNHDTTFQRAYDLKADFISLLDIVRSKFPNCKIFLLSDRGYTGYTTDEKHIEPKGYLNGWGVKLFVEDYINGKLPEYPFVNWLDYYWANGTEARFDGWDFKPTDYKSPQYVHFTQEKGNAMALSTHEKLKSGTGSSYWYK